jgi:L-threonylcarbamoyladenylate synthase
VTAAILATAAASPDPAVVAAARAVLAAGGVVGIPTDTVYGLAVDPWRPGAADRLFALKARPRAVTLPVLVADADGVAPLVASVPGVAVRLMAAWWPGPLTLVLDARPDLGADLGGTGATIGVRCPDHAVARALAAAGPIATTSANRHGAPPVTSAADLAALLPGVDLVVDAGTCDGRPSTVLDCTGGEPRVLRAGALDLAVLMASARRSAGDPPA